MIISNNLEIRVIHGFDEFQALKVEWNGILAGQYNTVFLTHQWLSAWWQVYHHGNKLWIWTARQNGNLVGIAPLMLQKKGLGFRRLVFLGSGEVTPNHLDIITIPGYRVAVLKALTSYFYDSSSNWDYIELDKIPADSNTPGEMTSTLNSTGIRLNSTGIRSRVEISASCPYADIDSFDSYINSRDHSTRRSYKRALQYLKRDYPEAHFSIIKTPEELTTTMDILVTMHQGRWTQKGYTGALSNERVIGFHKQIAERALESGNLRMYCLKIGDELAAVKYGYQVGNCIQLYLGSFDKRFALCSPGIILLGYVVQQALAEGIHRVDFLEGKEEYKQHWCTGVRDNLRLRAYSPHWRGNIAQTRIEASDRFIEYSVQHVPLNFRRPIWKTLKRWGIIQ